MGQRLNSIQKQYNTKQKMEFCSFACKLGSEWKIILFPLIYSFAVKFWVCNVFFKLLSYHNLFLWDSKFCPLCLEPKQTAWNGELFRAQALSVLLHYSFWTLLSQEMSHGCVTWLSYLSVPGRNANCPWHSRAKENTEIWRNSSSHQCFTESTSWEIRMYLHCRTSVFSIVICSFWDFLLNLWSGILNCFCQKFGHSCSLYSNVSCLVDSVY